MERASGILLHISSLPSKYGIGTFGISAYKFVDFLVKSGQKYWQILPLGMTSYGNSPYQSPSTFAGNINFIDFDILKNDGYLDIADYNSIDWGDNLNKVDFNKQFLNRKTVLKKAVEKFSLSDRDYINFCKNNKWLNDFSLFMAIKDCHNLVSFNNWEEEFIKKDEQAISKFNREHKDIIDFYKITQYWFYKQYKNLKSYANKNNIKIIGDIPFYIAYDSADVWANPELFELDQNLNPVNVAGVPPDFFSPDGQLWGNPLYNYDVMAKDNYSWWKNRLEHCFKLYDVLRIDHFRAFDSYYSIPFDSATAKTGEWRKGVGYKFFEKLDILDKNIIIEDLGDINDSVRKLVKYTGFPNMKILQFAFDSDSTNEFLPHNYDNNCVVYTGTHDNMTTKGWYKTLPLKSRLMFLKFVPKSILRNKTNALIDYAFMSKADTVIIPLQDFLNLDNKSRMNIPATLGDNWEWRISEKQLNEKLIDYINLLTKKSGRLYH